MDTYHSTLLADCVERERQERAQLTAERWYLHDPQVAGPTPRETLAGTLIAVARWIAPQHAALSLQRR